MTKGRACLSGIIPKCKPRGKEKEIRRGEREADGESKIFSMCLVEKNGTGVTAQFSPV